VRSSDYLVGSILDACTSSSPMRWSNLVLDQQRLLCKGESPTNLNGVGRCSDGHDRNTRTENHSSNDDLGESISAHAITLSAKQTHTWARVFEVVVRIIPTRMTTAPANIPLRRPKRSERTAAKGAPTMEPLHVHQQMMLKTREVRARYSHGVDSVDDGDL